MDNAPLAKTLLHDISELSLTDNERSGLADEFQRIEELSLMLGAPFSTDNT